MAGLLPIWVGLRTERERGELTTRGNGEGPPSSNTVQLYGTHKESFVVGQYIVTCNQKHKFTATTQGKSKNCSVY